MTITSVLALSGNLRLTSELGRHAIRFIGDEIGGDLDFDDFLDRGDVSEIKKHLQPSNVSVEC